MAGIQERYPYYYPFSRTGTDYSETSDINDWTMPPPASPPKLQELYRRRPIHPHNQRAGRKTHHAIAPMQPSPPPLLIPPAPCLNTWSNKKRRRAHKFYAPCRVNSEDATSSDAVVDACPPSPNAGLTSHPLFRRTRSSGFPSVPTPRYFRRPRYLRQEVGFGGRRPSKLCLPMACQPEPMYRPRIPNRKVPRGSHQQRLVYHHPCCPGVVADDVLCPLLCSTYPGEAFNHSFRRRCKFAGMSSISVSKPKHNKHLQRQSRSDEVAAEIEAVSSNLDALLAEYERMFAESSLRLCNSSSELTAGKRKTSKKCVPFAVSKPQTLAHLAMIKPRKTDPSKFPQLAVQTSNTGSAVSESVDKEGTVLDGLLSDLVTGGFVNSATGKQTEAIKDMYSKLHEQVSDKLESDQPVSLSHAPTSATTVDTIYKPSYTLQDLYSRKKPVELQQPISDPNYKVNKVKSNSSNISKMNNSKDGLLRPMCTLQDQYWNLNQAVGQPQRQNITYSLQDETLTSTDKSTIKAQSEVQQSVSGADAVQCKDAIELHNSKSYIVDMIDKALTREMETIAEESANSKPQINDKKCSAAQQFDGTNEELVEMEVSQAINFVNSESTCQLNSDLCMKITQTLTDTLLSSDNKESEHFSSSKSFINLPSNEPPYIRQLRQLRWDHLKHIQREMKRLEDIERFLDNCSSGHSMYSNISTASL